MKPLEAPAVGAPEAVDGLVRVADDEQLPAPAPGPDQPVLDIVDILKLVHQHMTEAPQAGDIPLQSFGQQVVEVQGAQVSQPGLIGVVQLRVQTGILRGHAVFHPGDRLEQRFSAALSAGLPQHLLRDGQGLAGTDEPHVAKQFQTDGVEGADGHGRHRPLAAQTLFQPGAHLCRRLIGESDGGNLSGADAPFLHQPGDPGHQGAGLAGAGARRHSGYRRGGGDGLQLRGIQRLRLGSSRGRFRRQNALQLPAGLGFAHRQVQAKQRDLPAEPGDLTGGQQGDDAVLPVKARPALHLPGPQAADALRHAGAGRVGDILHRHLPQDGELRPQGMEHLLVQRLGILPSGGDSGGGGDHLRQGRQTLKGFGTHGTKPCRTVRQGLHPVLHADGQLLPANGADAAQRRRLRRGQADAAVPVAIQVVLALLGEELHRALESLSGADGPDQLRVGEAGVQKIRLPAQLGGGMGVGVGDQGESVQGRDPPVHGRIRGEARLHRVDVAGQIPEALLHGIEAGEGAKQSEVGRPDVSGDEFRVRAGVQGQLQQVPTVQPQNGPSVGVDVADGLQPGGELVRRLQRGQQDQVVDFPGSAVALVDAADLPGDNEPGRLARGDIRQAQILAQGIDALSGGHQLLPQLGAPSGVGEVPGAHHSDALSPGPPVQVGEISVLTGGPGKAGVDVEVGNVHGSPPLSNQVDSIIISSIRQRKAEKSSPACSAGLLKKSFMGFACRRACASGREPGAGTLPGTGRRPG